MEIKSHLELHCVVMLRERPGHGWQQQRVSQEEGNENERDSPEGLDDGRHRLRRIGGRSWRLALVYIVKENQLLVSGCANTCENYFSVCLFCDPRDANSVGSCCTGYGEVRFAFVLTSGWYRDEVDSIYLHCGHITSHYALSEN